ncbi:hypothetical protein F5Y05DRAFT_288697 [Hypoxylon sp. FL0543]|nr:hypothetical protein F5Y05DRAFT_288697 [Hypoxylon sp. FL0543]
MEDAPSPSPLDQRNAYHHRLPTTAPATNIVRVPIHRNCNDFIQQFVPYDNPAVFDVRPAQWHPRHKGVFLFQYTDFRGWPAVQPAANEDVIKAYLSPLTREDEMSGVCDKLLLEARWWCCWAQGFTYLEPELRWILTLVFDLVNVVIEKQKAAAAMMPVPMVGEDVDMSADIESDPMKLLFWEGRHCLHNLMSVIRDMKEEFGVDALKLPRLPWFNEI